jgi:hypothetical protein
MIRPAKRACVISPVCFFCADPQIVSTCANAASIFPHDSALGWARLLAAHHVENVIRRALRFPPHDSSRRVRLHRLANLLFPSRSSNCFDYANAPGSFPATLPFAHLDCRPHTISNSVIRRTRHFPLDDSSRRVRLHRLTNLLFPSRSSNCLDYANAPGSFPATLPFARLDCRPHTMPLVPVSPATLCAAPPRSGPPLRPSASITQRPSFGPFASTTRRPSPSFCILRYDVFSSARPSSFQPPTSVLDMFRSIPIHYPLKQGSGIIVSDCEKGKAKYEDGVEVRCAWLMERENHDGNNRTATESSRID